MKIGKRMPARAGKMSLFQVGCLAMMLALAAPGAHAEDRAIKSKVQPVYPEIAKRMKVSGMVKLEVTVDADGKVTAVKTLSGNGMLSTAAEDAVRKWKFASGPGEATMNIDMNFALAQ